MFRFKSLTTKFIFIGFFMLVFIGIYIYGSFVFTHHIKDEAARINLAGSERMLTLDISSHLHFIVNDFSSPAKETHIKGAERAMAEYEEILFGLQNGSERLGLKPIQKSDKESISRLNTLIDLWQNTQKQTILNILKRPYKNKNETCVKCHSAIRDNLPKVKDLVQSLEKFYSKQMRYFDKFRFIILGLFIFSLATIIFYIRRSIVAPLKRLKEATKEFEKGNFAVSVDIKTRDEIGDFSATFNNMVQTIGMQFNKNKAYLKRLDMLNRISGAASQTLILDVLLGRALDEILALEILKLKRKGAIFLYDEKKKALELLVSRNFGDEQKTGCGHVFDGECLCGIAAEQREMLLSESNIEDKRHTKVYSDSEEHGHIILPLKVKDKVLGVLCLYLPAGIKLSGEEINLYKAITDILSVSIQNALNFSNIEKLKNQHGLILNCAGDGIYGVDLQGNCTFVNSPAQKMLGWDEGKLIGKHMHALAHYLKPDGTTYPAEECPIYAAAKDGVTRTVRDELFWRKDGSSFPVEYTSTPVTEKGGIIGAVVVFRDITERKKAEEELRGYAEQYHTMLSAALFGFWLADEKGKLLDVNDTYCRMSGYAREELLNLSVSDIEIIENPEDTARHIRKIIETGTDRFESKHRAKDDRVFDVEISTSFWRSQRKFVVFISDITERKKAEEILKGYSSSLEREVAERTKEIADANLELQAVNKELKLRRQEAESANKAKSDFLANMSHELRTPLNSIIGFSEAMIDDLAGPVTDAQKNYLKDIAESGNHLLSLINDILDLSKVEAGKMELELAEFNLSDLIDGSLVMFKEKAMKHNIKLKAGVEEGIANIKADERKIKQVLFNLLSNAMKFTPDAGSVHVHARKVAREEKEETADDSASPLGADFVEISVADTGTGISPEDQKRLFQPFQQLESTYTKKYAGTGLGLNLCKQFVELHGGRIWIESEVGKGSRFAFVIPVKHEGRDEG
jgi:PAS domain S-box-containing protein